MKALLLRHKKKKQEKDKKGKSSRSVDSNEGKSEAMESSKMVSSVKQQLAG